MDLENIKNNIIRAAEQKLRNHRFKGKESGLSIFEVARLRDVVSGNIENLKKESELFYGLHSLN